MVRIFFLCSEKIIIDMEILLNRWWQWNIVMGSKFKYLFFNMVCYIMSLHFSIKLMQGKYANNKFMWTGEILCL